MDTPVTPLPSEESIPDIEILDQDSISDFELTSDVYSIQSDRKSLMSVKPESVAAEWLERFQRNVLTEKNLEVHWKHKVPLVFSPKRDCNCLNITYDEEKAQQLLFEPLSRFLSANKDPTLFLKELSNFEDPPALCGRVFKVGEPTYSCRDCGTDPTCVLCVECFKQSAHRNHRYKISTSSGGGYCDCGDTEAWKSNVFCEAHQPSARNAEAEDDSARCAPCLPPEVANRAKMLFRIVLKYCYQMLTSELHCQLPPAFHLCPDDLVSFEDLACSETFCTVLYNDETHTFELVIQTLTRAAECSKKDAVDFATIIDREGRSIVKCSTFKACQVVKQVIERQTSRNGGKALKVSVMQSHVVAHQVFAMRLLSWMQELLTHSRGFRYIFCDVVMASKASAGPSRSSILEGIMLGDTQLWKAVRGLWHNLVITGMLKEYEMKKEFARIFTNNYADLMKEFICDDHDHAFSVTALSVQIFTVPTVAHYLIEEHDVIWTIMRTVLSEYEMKLNADGKLEFDRGTTSVIFKRTNFAILDLKYVLTSPPTVWSSKLKSNFRNGICDFIKLLSYMQEMDSVTRQTGQHMEYEPEWESAFNLYIKLAPVISLTLEWCGTDKDVLKRIYRECLTYLGFGYNLDTIKTVTRELANHSANCYEYDVATQPVSVHLPLTRLLAGLHLHLERFGLDFFSRDFDTQRKPCPELIMEPALRTQILISQVHAGMWKRNGYSLLNQLYFYHNVRCRSDMLDKDIITLQIGASLIESNEFLLHILNRFGLFAWSELDFDEKPPTSQDDDSLKHTTILVEEFFGLIITIVSARYTPGVAVVSKVDCIKKEIIQQLCIDCLTHSNLNKALVENVNYETGLETVIQELATFKKQSSSGSTYTYELKQEYFQEYDCYHYHYTREEQSKAEEKQRERKKAKGEPEFFPPPRLPLFSPGFNLVVNVLKSDVLFRLMTVVLQRSLKKKSRSYTDSQLSKVLHLIGHGLNEEIARSEQEEEHFFQFAECAKRWNIFNLLEEVLKDPTLSQHHAMIKWIRTQYNYIKPKDVVSTSPEQMDVKVQQTNEEEMKEKKAKAEAAKKRYLDKMLQAQNSFMAKNKELFVAESASPSVNEDMEVSCLSSIALGPNQTLPQFNDEIQICILCQETCPVDIENKPFVLATFIQRSTVQCKFRDKLLTECDNKSDNRFLQERDPLLLAPDLLTAPMVSCCGHIMHISCWEKHFEGVVMKERRRPYRLRHPLSFDVDKNEYLCPLCDCINNAVLPLASPFPLLHPNLKTPESIPEASFEVFIQGINILLKHKLPVTKKDDDASARYMPTADDHSKVLGSDTKRLQLWKTLSPEALETELGAAALSFRTLFPTFEYIEEDEEPYAPTFLELLSVFTQMVYTIGLDVPPHSTDYRQILMVWQAVSLTITSLEAFHRDQQLIFFGEDVPQRKTLSLRYLVRGCAVITDQYRLHSIDPIQSHFLKLMTTLLQNPFDSPCVLEVDAFTLLISLTFSIPSLYWGAKLVVGVSQQVALPTGTLRDYYLLRLVFMFHLSQILITGDFSDYITPNEADDSMDFEDIDGPRPTIESNSIPRKDHIFSEVWRRIGKAPVDCHVDYDGVWKSMCQSSVPFLRCCAKFYEHLTGVPVPKSLEKLESSFDDLIAYLGLPKSFNDLFISPFEWQLPYKWASHPSVIKMLLETEIYKTKSRTEVTLPKTLVVKYPRHSGRLVELPEDYSELINSVSFFTCLNCDFHDSRTPTMCLICGAMLCSQSYCCQSELGQVSVGACTYHAYYCGGGNGIFLRIRECKVFFLGGRSKGCFMSPPYLDEYGETDQGLRRGNPMTLSKEKYDVFRRIWLQHAIPEEIARITEHSSSIVTTEWQYL